MMRQTTTLACVLAALVVSAIGVYALAQQAAPAKQAAATAYTCPMHQDAKAAQAGKCPKCGMALVEAASKVPAPAMPCCPGRTMSGAAKGASGAKAAAAQTNKNSEMMRRCRVMKNMPIFLDSPCAIYGQAQGLGLSEDQKKKLIEIANQARRQALAVLTAEQRKKLGDVPDKPMTMMQMHQQICPKMSPKTRKMMEGGKRGRKMTCPMMRGGSTP